MRKWEEAYLFRDLGSASLRAYAIRCDNILPFFSEWCNFTLEVKSSHSLSQWGQLAENLGEVRYL